MKHAPTVLLGVALGLAWWVWPADEGALHAQPVAAESDPARLLRDQPSAAGAPQAAASAASTATR